MECPGCKDKDAYVGLNAVDCVNPKCVHFKEAYLEEKLKTAEQNFAALIEEYGISEELHDIMHEMWCQEVDVDLQAALEAWRQSNADPGDE
jgi:hypothetical protein